MKGACFAPLKVMFFCSGTSKDQGYQKAFFHQGTIQINQRKKWI